MPHAAESQSPFTKGYSLFVFSLLFGLYMFDYIDRMIIVSLFPFLKADWGLTDTQCGLLVSAVYWSILIFSFPVSVLVDRWSRKNSIGLMGLLWGLATLACAFTRNFRHLFVVRTAIGLGEAGYAPGGTALISALFPPEKRARVLGLWNASIPLGGALGIFIGGVVAEHYGWRHAFGLVALPGMVLAVMFFFVRDYKTIDLVRTRGGPEGGVQIRMGWKESAGEFTRSKALIFNNLAFAANVFVTTSLMTWLPTYFSRVYDLPMSRAGLKSGLVMMLAVVGAPAGGYLADRWLTVRPTARLLFPALSSLATALFIFLSFGLLEGQMQFLALLATGVTAVAFVPASVAVTQDVVHPGLRATSLSLNIICQHLLGSALGPAFVGAVSDAHDLRTGLMCLPVFCVAASALYVLASRYYVEDVSRVEAVAVAF